MFGHLLSFFRRAITRDRRGVAAVEFAVVAPVMITLLAGAANVGFAVDHAIALANAARAGAQHLIAQPNDAAGARAAAQAVLPGSTAAVSPMACTCPASVSAATGGSAVNCETGSCAANIGMVRSLTVTVTMAPRQIPGLATFTPDPVRSRSVVVRVQ
jgi:Flp pilus assembly protein TadG